MKLKEKHILILIVIIVLLVGSAIFYYNYQRAAKLSAQPKTSYAPAGQLVSGFPSELVLDSKALVKESYSIDSSTTSQKTAIFNSNKSTYEFFVLSRDYFIKAGWKLTNIEADPKGDNIVFNAWRGENELNIAINKQDNGSQLTVSYLAKNK